MDAEVKKILEDHEKRIRNLENSRLKSKKESGSKADKDYEGLMGGIRFLIDNNFLNEPKKVAEIAAELKGERYHYPLKSIHKVLNVDFFQKKILNRFKEKDGLKYVLRK